MNIKLAALKDAISCNQCGAIIEPNSDFLSLGESFHICSNECLQQSGVKVIISGMRNNCLNGEFKFNFIPSQSSQDPFE